MNQQLDKLSSGKGFRDNDAPIMIDSGASIHEAPESSGVRVRLPPAEEQSRREE